MPFGPGPAVAHPLEDPVVGGEGVAGAVGDLGQRRAPVVGELALGDDDLGHHRVAHQRDQLVLVADVVVERHRPGAEALGDAAHRDGVEAFGVGDLDRRAGDVGAGVGGAARGRFLAEPDQRLDLVGGGASASRAFGPLDRPGDLLPRPVFGLGDPLERPRDLLLRALGVLADPRLRPVRAFSRARASRALLRARSARGSRPRSNRSTFRTSYCYRARTLYHDNVRGTK